jgi:hypothetical protein
LGRNVAGQQEAAAELTVMKQKLLLGLAFVVAVAVLAVLLHRLPQLSLYTSQSHATARVIAFGICLAMMVLSWPRLYSGKISIVLFALLFVELIIYFRPVPIASAGIGEAVPWFFPFWFKVNLLNIVLLPTALGLVIYDYLHEEKSSFLALAAIYLVLLATLFPFEQICRWGTYALM